MIRDLARPRHRSQRHASGSTGPFLACLTAAFLLVMVLVPTIVGDGAPDTLAAPSPSRAITLTLAGLPTSSPIAVVYDDLGTPHVIAPTETAGYGGLCWAMAHDRLFQLDLLRRSAEGRLAEIVGAGPDNAVLQQDGRDVGVRYEISANRSCACHVLVGFNEPLQL